MYIEYAVVAGYLLILLSVGFVFKKLNTDVSDYFRSGCRATWWMVGASAFMTAFSAWTFTGAAGAAYEAGWSVGIIFFANVGGFLLHALFLAPWFRQLRAITVPEVIRKRFGPTTQQFYAWITVPLQLAYAALWLYGLAIFSAAVFGFSVQHVIVATGLVVLVYSVSGGNWAVMATDFLQSLILFPITLLVAVLCLMKLGGIGGFITSINHAPFADQYALINAANDFPGGKYALAWASAVVVYKLIGHATMNASAKYFAVKDGTEARKAAALAAGLMAVGSLVWFIPPIAARLLINDQVTAMTITKPGEASYALMSMNVLPTGLTGVMVVAMFSATMSSMDSGLNRNAAIFTRDIYPALCKLFGTVPATGTRLLRWGQAFSMLFGVAIIGLASYFAGAGGKGVFELMLNVGGMLALPMALPLLLAMFVRKAPWWSAIFSVSVTMIPAAWAFLAGDWPYEWVIFTNVAVGVGSFAATMPFWRTADQAYRRQVDGFFETMHRPVDFEAEVGQPADGSQLRVVGWFAVVMGSAICAMVLLPNPWAGRLCIVLVGGFVAVVGAAMVRAGNRQPAEAEHTAAPSTPRPVSDPI